MEILFEGIILRPWSLTDESILAKIADNKRIANNLRDGFPNPYSLDDARNWLKLIVPENDPPRYFAIIADNCLSGSIGIIAKTNIYRKNVEIGYFIGEEFWGRGIATKAIKAATTYAFSTFDIVRVYAEPFSDNPGSRRALVKAGFTLEAVFKNYVIKNGNIKDSCIYSVLRENWKFE
jgi:[ribosomal protein S5]-alanine N-acetyltransferase